MYGVGQQVIYGIHGVCRIIDREEKRVDRKNIPYWVLEPIRNPGARFYLPAENATALSKIRPLLDAQRLQTLILPENIPDVWIPEDNRRRQNYRQIVNGVDFSQILGMVVALHRHRLRQQENGRKLHMMDDNLLQDGWRILQMELSVVLQIPPEQVANYIEEALR